MKVMTEEKKLKLIKTILFISLSLLALNFVYDIFTKGSRKNESIIDNENETERVEKLFLEALSENGIDKKYIQKKISKNEDSKRYFYEIMVPKDFSIPSLIADYQEKLLPYNIKLNSSEKRNNLALKAIRGNHILLVASFIHSDKAKIKKNNIGLVIYDFFQASEKEKEQILNWPYKLNLIALPGSEFIELKKTKNYFNKKIYFIINDQIEDIKYKVNSRMSHARLKSAAANLANLAGDEMIIFIDNRAEIANSIALEFIKNEFDKRNVKLFFLKNFKEIEDEKFQELLSKIEYYLNPEIFNKEIYLISYKNFLLAKESFQKAAKKSSNFIYFDVF